VRGLIHFLLHLTIQAPASSLFISGCDPGHGGGSTLVRKLNFLTLKDADRRLTLIYKEKYRCKSYGIYVNLRQKITLPYFYQ